MGGEFDIASDLVRCAHAEGDVGDRGVPEAELDGCRRQRRPALRGQCCERLGLVEDLSGCVLVVVLRLPARVGVGEDPGVEDADVDDTDPAGGARRDEVLATSLFEERVPARLHDDVDVGLGDEAGEHLRLVHPGTPRADDPLVAQACEFGHGPVDRLGPVVVGVVDVDDVDAVEAQPLEGLLEGAADAVRGVVAHTGLVAGHGEALVVPLLRVLRGADEPTDLRRDEVLLTGLGPQHLAEATLAQPETVVGCGVVVPDSQ
ncbi:Uncharacterised protein [Mycobacteroides abscessus subsp. abscessus]|nr:Uncharacterised protein [Mycobacteroides abscessus subsp. abscessus]